jgi:hypothetical protein
MLKPPHPSYPNPVGVGGNISAGWLLRCDPSRDAINSFLSEGSAGASGYAGVGGGVSTNAAGTAVTAGVGAGVGVGGNNNWYMGNVFDE